MCLVRGLQSGQLLNPCRGSCKHGLLYCRFPLAQRIILSCQDGAMFHVVLIQPEIPPNAGNVIRLCANAGVELHLIHPLGFVMDDSRLRRAGLDYREWARIHEHADIEAFRRRQQPGRVFALSSKASTSYHSIAYQAGDCFVFGPETRGLDSGMLRQLQATELLRIPMVADSRSLNLSNSVSIVVYEAWRQQGFAGGS